MLQPKNPQVRSIAANLSDCRNLTAARAQTMPDANPSQSPMFLGIGKFIPRPKMISIPVIASVIARMRRPVIASPRIRRANIVLHTGVR